MSQCPNVYTFQINVLGTEIIQYDGEQLWVPIDEQRAAFILVTVNPVTQQCREERVLNPRQRLAGRGESETWRGILLYAVLLIIDDTLRTRVSDKSKGAVTKRTAFRNSK